jgi:hypothetical protein
VFGLAPRNWCENPRTTDQRSGVTVVALWEEKRGGAQDRAAARS